MQYVSNILSIHDITIKYYEQSYTGTGYMRYDFPAFEGKYIFTITYLVTFFKSGNANMIRVFLLSDEDLIILRQPSPVLNQAYPAQTYFLAKAGDQISFGAYVTEQPFWYYVSYQYYKFPSL